MTSKPTFGSNDMEIDFTWHSTPQLWIAMRKGICPCPECRAPFGMGKTKEAAVKALKEWEEDLALKALDAQADD